MKDRLSVQRRNRYLKLRVEIKNAAIIVNRQLLMVYRTRNIHGPNSISNPVYVVCISLTSTAISLYCMVGNFRGSIFCGLGSTDDFVGLFS